MQPRSAEEVRARREENLARLTEPYSVGSMWTAFEWCRSAAVYALRRSYPTAAIGQRAHARREQIIAECAATLQVCGDEVWALLPAGPQPRKSRALDFQAASALAKKPRDKQTAAKAWLMFADRQIDRYEGRPGGELRAQADQIQARVTALFIAWAREMDADDYGQ
jgi:hypothetical protein